MASGTHLRLFHTLTLGRVARSRAVRPRRVHARSTCGGESPRPNRCVGADFTAADLTSANVQDANFSGATLAKGALASAKHIPETGWADAQTGVYSGSVHIFTAGFHEYLTNLSGQYRWRYSCHADSRHLRARRRRAALRFLYQITLKQTWAADAIIPRQPSGLRVIGSRWV